MDPTLYETITYWWKEQPLRYLFNKFLVSVFYTYRYCMILLESQKKSCKILIYHTLEVIAIASGRTNIFFLIASAPTFALNQLKKIIIITKGQEVVIECKPQGSPKPTISWKKGDRAIRENKRLEVYFIIQTLHIKLFWSCKWYTQSTQERVLQ